jgi:hypothetical protein
MLLRITGWIPRGTIADSQLSRDRSSGVAYWYQSLQGSDPGVRGQLFTTLCDTVHESQCVLGVVKYHITITVGKSV